MRICSHFFEHFLLTGLHFFCFCFFFLRIFPRFRMPFYFFFWILLFQHEVFIFVVVGRRVLSSGWLASYVGQSEVPASTTTVLNCLWTSRVHVTHLVFDFREREKNEQYVKICFCVSPSPFSIPRFHDLRAREAQPRHQEFLYFAYSSKEPFSHM